MRGARWLLLVAMAVVIGGVGLTYRAQKKALRDQSPPKPAVLSLDLNSSAENWHYTETDTKTGRVIADISAGDFRQVKDSSRVELKAVTLKLPSRHGADTYDLIKSAAATFFANEHRLYSDGDVSITLDVPNQGEPSHPLISIRSSGVTFNSETGRAETDRPSSFTFQYGEGKSSGAFYDPAAHELQMKKDVEVQWKTPGPNAKPMKIEAETLSYRETAAEIWMPSWARLTRDTTQIEGQESVIHLEDGAIRQVSTTKAHGSENDPARKLRYAADRLALVFNDDAEVQRIDGQGNAELLATSEASETKVTAPSVTLNFEMQTGQSALSEVLTKGGAVVVSRPLPLPGRALPESTALRSDTIELKMKPGGKELNSVVTHSPGQLEFLPNLPAQHHRTLDGSEMVIAYGAQNRIESFRAKNVKTRTDPTEDERKRNRAPALTSSQEMLARFETGSSRLASMEQWGEFAYSEGDRRARAAKATLDSDENVMLLDTTARVWDPTGSTSGDHIRMDQRTGNFTAEGSVYSSRLPDKDEKNNPGMLSGDDPIEAQAGKMESTNRNRTIHYERNVNLSQGANRIQADVVDVDRQKQALAADGSVVTNLWEQPKNDPNEQKKKASAAILTVVHAAHLTYTDRDRLALYTGGVVLERPGLHVKARELRAFLADSTAESRLDKAIAEGSVEIVQKALDRTRTGTGEHGEYYPDEQKVILRGGEPLLADSVKGTTRGAELTYFANDDRLLVNGSSDQPAKSRIRRK